MPSGNIVMDATTGTAVYFVFLLSEHVNGYIIQLNLNKLL